MSDGLHPDTIARLMVPGLSLAGCVQAHLWRDTTRASGLSEGQRSTFFPASTFCGISWVLEGDGWQQMPDGERIPMVDPVVLGGPRTRPAHYVSAAGSRVFFTVIHPDALHALTGLDLSQLVDRTIPLDGLGPDWQTLNRAMLAAPDEQACQALLEDFLRPRWRAHCAQQGLSFPYRDWMQNLALRLVASGRGNSLRQLERRIKQWSGQSQRSLRQMQRGEQAFFAVRRSLEAGEVVWSVLAQEVGYADQAHLCRETRRLTGCSPEVLRVRIFRDEAYWLYRIWA
ncbi:MAG TPA: AraC family transcriptional regulator [Burkholderiaceae bacterium]|nr:AraC family transcriptional regulator [Burkholderiaceae bacterium]